MSTTRSAFFAASRWSLAATLVVLFGLGIGVRLFNLTNPPLDFHPTRQLLSALKARGMYYQSTPGLPDWQRKMAIQQWRLKAEVEPEVFERLVALTYRVTGVQLWVPRVYASFFWLIGGVFLFLLVRDLASVDGAVAATAYFLFWPYGVIASRSFQPDILMIASIVIFWWSIRRWSKNQTWPWAVFAALAGGMAIYVKFVAAFFVVGAALPTALSTLGRRMIRNPQIWTMAVLGSLPATIYVYYGVVERSFLGRQFGGRFIPSLLLSPLNYIQWAALAGVAAGTLAVALGLLGLLLARDRAVRALLIGLWVAYLLFGLIFDYHIATHDYYHLPLIPIVALSLAPSAEAFIGWLAGLTSGKWLRLPVYGVLLYAVLGVTWESRAALKAVDYRPQVAMWAQIGDKMGHGPNVVALTQDYGSRLEYWGWQNAVIWPNSGDTDYHEVRGGSITFAELFDKLTLGNAYFLVTDFGEFSRQPELKARLTGFAVYAQGDDYVIYDLQKPRAP